MPESAQYQANSIKVVAGDVSVVLFCYLVLQLSRKIYTIRTVLMLRIGKQMNSTVLVCPNAATAPINITTMSRQITKPTTIKIFLFSFIDLLPFVF